MWGAKAPVTALNTLQSHISYLRGVLGTKAAILARPPGCVLDLEGEATDVEAAERLIRQGTQSTDRTQAVAQQQTALALWRGPPLVDVAGLAWVNEQVERLDLVMLHAEQPVAEARLALGEHAQLAPDLRRLVQQHPLHEQFHRLLMITVSRWSPSRRAHRLPAVTSHPGRQPRHRPRPGAARAGSLWMPNWSSMAGTCGVAGR